MEVAPCLSLSSQNWDFGCWYWVSDLFTSICNMLVLVLVFIMGFKVLQMSTRCREMGRFIGEARRNSIDFGDGFRSSSGFGCLCSSKNLSCEGGIWKFMKEVKNLIVDCSEEIKEQGVEKGDIGNLGCRRREGSNFMHCKNGHRTQACMATKPVDLGNGFFSENDVGRICGSKILSFCCHLLRSMKHWILLPKLNGDGETDIDTGNSSCRRKETFVGCMDENDSSIKWIREKEKREQEEEEIFEECEKDNMWFLQEDQDSTYLKHKKGRVHVSSAANFMDKSNDDYSGTTCFTRNFMEEDSDREGEREDHEGFEAENFMHLKNTIRIEKERRHAACLELEKERMAAASAASEALVMIQRLQSEKNLVEIEARQYRYVAELKQLYDQEIIRSLQWIISKHELERTVLENQLKHCRKSLQQKGWFDETKEEEHQDDGLMGQVICVRKSFVSELAEIAD